MVLRTAVLLALLANATQFAAAQKQSSPIAAADRQSNPSSDVRVILEQETFHVPTDIIPWISRDVKLPKLGSGAVLDKQQAKALSEIVDRLYRNALPQLALRDGETWKDVRGQDYYGFQPRIADHGRAVKLRVTFGRGNYRLVVDETIPQGAQLLVHYNRYASMPESTYLDQVADWIFPSREHTPDYSEAFLLVTPRLASRNEPQKQPAAK
jgi:hypothetical protein